MLTRLFLSRQEPPFENLSFTVGAKDSLILPEGRKLSIPFMQHFSSNSEKKKKNLMKLSCIPDKLGHWETQKPKIISLYATNAKLACHPSLRIEHSKPSSLHWTSNPPCPQFLGYKPDLHLCLPLLNSCPLKNMAQSVQNPS